MVTAKEKQQEDPVERADWHKEIEGKGLGSYVSFVFDSPWPFAQMKRRTWDMEKCLYWMFIDFLQFMEHPPEDLHLLNVLSCRFIPKKHVFFKRIFFDPRTATTVLMAFLPGHPEQCAHEFAVLSWLTTRALLQRPWLDLGFDLSMEFWGVSSLTGDGWVRSRKDDLGWLPKKSVMCNPQKATKSVPVLRNTVVFGSAY